MGRTVTVYSVGRTPEEAIEALAKELQWGAIDNMAGLEGGSAEYQWGRSFTADTTSMKAAGVFVPGGVVITWWK